MGNRCHGTQPDGVTARGGEGDPKQTGQSQNSKFPDDLVQKGKQLSQAIPFPAHPLANPLSGGGGEALNMFTEKLWCVWPENATFETLLLHHENPRMPQCPPEGSS